MSGEVCRNQGAPMAEKPCGFCHEGPCGPERYVLLRSSDVEALMEEWGDLDCDPFWKPVAFSYVMVGSGVPATAPDRGWEIHEPDDTLIVTVEDEDPPPVPVTAPVHPGGERPPHVWLNGSCIAMLSDLPDGTWFNYDTDDPTSVDEADEHWRTMSVHPEPVTVVRWADGPTEQPEWVCGWTDVGANCLPGDPCDPDTCGYSGSTPQAPTVDEPDLGPWCCYAGEVGYPGSECSSENPIHAPTQCGYDNVRRGLVAAPTVDSVPVPRADVIAAASIMQEARFCEGLQEWWGTDSDRMARLDAALDAMRRCGGVQ